MTAGQTFVVALEFVNQSAGNLFASGVGIDLDGCQANSNSVNVMPGGWLDACALGISGDFGIRAIIDVPEPRIAALWMLSIAGFAVALRDRL